MRLLTVNRSLVPQLLFPIGKFTTIILLNFDHTVNTLFWSQGQSRAATGIPGIYAHVPKKTTYPLPNLCGGTS